VFPDFQSGRRRLLVRSDAALFVAGELGWPWKAAQSMRFVPKWIRDRVYDAIAGTRYQLFGRSDRCLVPRPEFRSRFIEWEE
jgi:predicted DCC family thiol-disulfide oxidoreductase YuxK